jgi:putative effector of murein hydrolase LrgA (UPF0299 family)
MSTHTAQIDELGTSAPAAAVRTSIAAANRDRIWMIAGVALATGLVGLFVTIGADARWLAALGRVIVARGAIPRGVPFASASTAHWANTLVLAELIFHALESAFGDRGLAVAELVAVAAGLGILAQDARSEGARPSQIAVTLLLVTVAAFPSLAVARVQMFSLVLFPALLALLRAEERRPSTRIWLALPLLALWSNLHGAALVGLAVLYAYLALSRFRRQRLQAIGVALGALVALCVTPAGISTISYYHGLLTNVAAQQGVGQWAPLGASPFDWVTVAVVVALMFRLRRRLPRLWEIAAMIGLAALTVKAARDGVWLLFMLVAPAAWDGRERGRWGGLAPGLAVFGLLLIVMDLAKAPHPSGVSQRMVSQAIEMAHGTPVLADGLPAEQVALAGGRVWAGNPLDAFSHRVQTEYVDFIQGTAGGRAALSAQGVRYALVTRGSAAASLTAHDRRYTEVASDATAVLYGAAR